MFEAAALGDVDRLRSVLEDEPSRATAYSGDGFTASALRGVLRPSGRRVAAHRARCRGRRVRPRMDDRNRAALRGQPSPVRGRTGPPGSRSEPDVRQSAGWTPLHAAAMNGDLASVELLLAAGADAAATNDEGRSVADLAKESGDDATIERVRSALQAARRSRRRRTPAPSSRTGSRARRRSVLP